MNTWVFLNWRCHWLNFEISIYAILIDNKRVAVSSLKKNHLNNQRYWRCMFTCSVFDQCSVYIGCSNSMVLVTWHMNHITWLIIIMTSDRHVRYYMRRSIGRYTLHCVALFVYCSNSTWALLLLYSVYLCLDRRVISWNQGQSIAFLLWSIYQLKFTIISVCIQCTLYSLQVHQPNTDYIPCFDKSNNNHESL